MICWLDIAPASDAGVALEFRCSASSGQDHDFPVRLQHQAPFLQGRNVKAEGRHGAS